VPDVPVLVIEGDQMTDSAQGASRRNFLALAGAGAAAAGTAALLPTASADAATPKGPAHPGPLVAYVRDTASGEISVNVGEREVVVHDRDLAQRIARIAGRES
jgi:Rieske Fe-S protein